MGITTITKGLQLYTAGIKNKMKQIVRIIYATLNTTTDDEIRISSISDSLIYLWVQF